MFVTVICICRVRAVPCKVRDEGDWWSWVRFRRSLLLLCLCTVNHRWPRARIRGGLAFRTRRVRCSEGMGLGRTVGGRL
jgi:hypothetical protein